MKKLAVVAGLAVWVLSDDWLLGLSAFVLALGWVFLPAEEGPPVLALAYTLQWVTVCIGLYYVAITGRPLQATLGSDYQPMVLIGLGCLVAILAGLLLGQYLVGRLRPLEGVRPAYALTFKSLVMTYLGATAVAGFVHEFAWSFPTITQAIIAVSFLRLGLLYLVLRRLVADDRWAVMALVLLGEIGLGFTGFHAGFREPLIMAVLAFLERFDRRNVRHWASLGVLCAGMAVLGVTWISIRVNYRERYLADEAFAQNRGARFDSITAAAKQWAAQDRSQFYGNVDVFIDRLWAIYYPALAVARVPNVEPHTNGKLMTDTLQLRLHAACVLPRQTGSWIGQRAGPQILRGVGRRRRAGYRHRVRVRGRIVHRLRRSHDVPARVRLGDVHGYLLCRHVQVFSPSRHRGVGDHRHLLADPVSIRALVDKNDRPGRHAHDLRRQPQLRPGSPLVPEIQDRVRRAAGGCRGGTRRRTAAAPPAALQVNIWNGAAVLYARYRLGLVDADTQTTAAERACLARYASGRRSLVEIGVMHGATTALLRSAMALDGVVTGIDRHLPGKLLVSFERLVAKHELARYPRGRAVLLREWSHEAARNWTTPIDFLFIDGDHSWTGLERDWQDWTAHLVPGGIVALHDSRPLPDRQVYDSVQFTRDIVLHDPRFAVVDTVDSLTVLQRI